MLLLKMGTCKGICGTIKLLRQGLCFQIGNGANIKVFKDPCIPGLEHFVPKPVIDMNDILFELIVKDLADQNRRWNWGLLN